MLISGWGKYPEINSQQIFPSTISRLRDHLITNQSFRGIARGLGRSYGDSSLANQCISTRYLNHVLGFDDDTGTIHCSAGVSLAEVLEIAIPRGWFLPVTPGTKFVTVGGAIASDVHGKNHHNAGCISAYVESIRIMLGNAEMITCSANENTDLFLATCGGMGLTGIILDAKIKLTPINSSLINQTTLKAKNLEHALELFDAHKEATYSVAWIDSLAKGKDLGKSVILLGEHSATGQLQFTENKNFTVPLTMPNFVLNSIAVNAYNKLYYNRVGRKTQQLNKVDYDAFFYPLDSVNYWNRMYGKNGFTQYQFVIPYEAGVEAVKNILTQISISRRGSFLTVLKQFGEANNNYLSFPMKGYTLALDFKIEPGLLEFLDTLDKVVVEYGGRIYLTKDARMNEATFKASYPKWEKFIDVRNKYYAIEKFNSLQSDRLGLSGHA